MHDQLFEYFSVSLSYPIPQYRDALNRLASITQEVRTKTDKEERWGELRSAIASFLDRTEKLTVEEFEELYTRTFDISPVSSLEIGWHLYGEAYERGAFLVRMRELLRAHGIEESTELPDHLVHVLKLLGRLEGQEREEFGSRFLLPALKKILEGFNGKSNPFEHLLRALQTALELDQLQGVTHHG